MREAWTDDRLDDLNRKVDEGFRRVDKQFERLEGEMDARFNRVDDRFERMEERIHDRLDAIQRTMVLGMAAMCGTVVTAFVGLASLIVLQM